MTTIYRVNDCDWVAADSLEQAVAFYTEFTGSADMTEDAYELDATELVMLTFTNDEYGFWGLPLGACSFRDALAGALADGETPPFFFASTEQ